MILNLFVQQKQESNTITTNFFFLNDCPIDGTNVPLGRQPLQYLL